MVPVEQILAGDGCNGRIFGDARIRIVRAIDELCGFASRDPSTSSLRREMASKYSFCARSILSARNSGSRSRSSNTLKTSSKSSFRHEKRDGRGIGTAVGFDLGGADFEKVVELIAGLRLGAAGAPDFAVDIEHARLVGGL